MAKQNIDDQVVLNQSPDALVVFLNLDETGVPIRDVDAAKIVPDIDDIMSISCDMGKTGAIGRFSLTINNANNKYFTSDDMTGEIEHLKGGQVVVSDDSDNNSTYNTHPPGVTWKNTSSFLNNHVYRKMFSPTGKSVIYLYFQDPADTYVIDDSYTNRLDVHKLDFLKKGAIKYRVIPEDELESFAKNAGNLSSTQKISTVDSNETSSVITKEALRQQESLIRQNQLARRTEEIEISLGNKTANERLIKDKGTSDVELKLALARQQMYKDLTDEKMDPNEALLTIYGRDNRFVTNVTAPPLIFHSSASETLAQFSNNKQSSAQTDGTTTEINRLSLDEAITLLMDSQIQAAFFEKYGGQLEHGRCMFEPMQLCVIFMSRRFRDAADPDDMIVAFTGYVDVVSDGFDGTSQIISITGSDVSKLMHITQANINPSLFTKKLPGASEFKIWQTRFGGLEGPEIIKLLTIGGELDESSGGGKIHGTGSFDVSITVGTGVADFNSTYRNTASRTRLLNNLVLSQDEALGNAPDNIEKLFFSTKKVHIQALPFDTSPVSPLQSYDVFKKIFGMSFGNWQNEYVTHLELANQVAQLTNYEFYADPNGEIWYHQPRFHNYHMLTDSNPEIYVLRDEDILNCNLSESDEQVITSVYVVGAPNFYTGPKEPIKMVGFYEDPSLVLKYGRRMVSVSHPYVVTEGNIGYFARSYLVRANAARFVGKVTILGRPEIRMHMPVYIPYRNMIYYINGISHSFTMGDKFQTVLTLKYGRKPWEIIPEILDYNDTAHPNLSGQAGKKATHVQNVVDTTTAPDSTILRPGASQSITTIGQL